MKRLEGVGGAAFLWPLLVALLFVLRPLSPPSADTQEIGWFIEIAPWWWYLRWPLTHLACVGIHRLTGLSGVESLALFSSMAGALFFLTVAAVARRDRGILLVLVSSVTLTMIGHAEVYAWPNLFLLWLLLLGPRHLEGEIPLAPIAGLFALGCLFHMLLVFYAPALLWLAWRGRRLALARGGDRKRLDGDLALSLGVVIAFFMIITVIPMLTEDIGGLNNDLERLVPLTMPLEPRLEQQLLFRPTHLEAIGIFLLLGCPAGMGLVALRLRRALATEALRFTSVAALCALGFLILWHPDMGVWGDWDLFSHVGLVLNVLAWRLWAGPSSLAPGKGDVIRSDSPLPGETAP